MLKPQLDFDQLRAAGVVSDLRGRSQPFPGRTETEDSLVFVAVCPPVDSATGGHN